MSILGIAARTVALRAYDIPILIDRDEARRRAEAELAKAKYGGTPTAVTRALDLIQRFVEWLLSVLGRLDPGQQSDAGVNRGFLLAVVLLLAAIALVVWRVGLPRWRKRTEAGAVETDPTVEALDYRARSEAEAAAGQWRDAVRDRFRALVRELETRTILDVRPARTALEAAVGAGRHLPDLTGPLLGGADEFNAVVFGDRAADENAYRRMVELDEAVTAAADRVDLAADATSTAVHSTGVGRVTGPRRKLLLGGAAVVVAALILLVIGTFRHQVSIQAADDPRSTTAQGVRALAQLLTDEGVRIETTDDVESAVAASDGQTLLVVAAPHRLTDEQAARIGRATYGRLLLLRPSITALRAFGVPAEPTAAPIGPVPPGCADPAATRAGAIDGYDLRNGYASAAGTVTLSCYSEGQGAAWLRVGGPFGPVDLVAGGISNQVLGHEGNAAFGMNVFGSQPKIVWLMSRGSQDGRPPEIGPTMLPGWWAPAVVQAFVALIVVGIWRGRRLGPILREPLPVTVRAAETVEGHGRMYARIGARDRAAEALRAGVRDRLGRVYGHGFAGSPTAGRDDVLALSAAIAARTGRPAAEIARLLAGPPPGSDDELVALAHHLDRLEQEARQL